MLTGFVYSRHECKTLPAPLLLHHLPSHVPADTPLDLFFSAQLGPILTILERNFRKDTKELLDLKWFNLHFFVEGFKLKFKYRQFQLSPSFAGSAGLEAWHLTPWGKSFSVQRLLVHNADKRFEALAPQHKKKPYAKMCTEPACNKAATVTYQLSNVVLEKEHTALSCYASSVSDTLLTCIRSLSLALPENSKFFSAYLKQIAPKVSLPYSIQWLNPYLLNATIYSTISCKQKEKKNTSKNNTWFFKGFLIQ